MIKIEITDERLPEFQKLLNKALNTWDNAPKWIWDLDAEAQARAKQLVEEKKDG